MEDPTGISTIFVKKDTFIEWLSSTAIMLLINISCVNVLVFEHTFNCTIFKSVFSLANEIKKQQADE